MVSKRRTEKVGPGALGLVLTILAMASPAGAAPTMDELRQKNLAANIEELRAVAPEAVGTYEAASRAYYNDRYAEAIQGFEAVNRAAPNYGPALRRRCSCQLHLGHRDEALKLCRKAAEDPRAENLSVLAMTLAYPGMPSTPEEREEAKKLARRAVELAPDDPWSHVAECTVGVGADDLDMLRECLPKVHELAPREYGGAFQVAFTRLLLDQKPLSTELINEAESAVGFASTLGVDPTELARERCHLALAKNDTKALDTYSKILLRRVPKDPSAHTLAALAAGGLGEFSRARNEIDTAERLGLPREQADRLRDSIDEAQPFYQRWYKPALWAVGLWFAGFTLLTLVGMGLSRMALSASQKVPTEVSGRALGMTSGVRSTYRAVLWLTCVYYYLSLPLVVASVFVIGGGIIYFFFMIGRIPIKLVLIIGLVVLVTFWAILKSLFKRPVETDPGKRIEKADHPRLATVLEEVAGKVGTRSVDSVFLTPGTEIAVFERGRLLAQLRSRTERCLILGLGVLDGMRLPEFKSILAHEYGHFSNRDTAGGGFALAVRRSLLTVAEGLALAGAATPANPAWLFVVNFHKLFLRISQGASRLQEVLADRWAAFAYGSQNFVRGLSHVIKKSVAFEAHAESVLKEVIEGKKALSNLYQYQPEKAVPTGELDKAFEEAMGAIPSPYDSHPSPKDRVAWVTGLNAESTEEAEGADDVWSLFESREALEAEMTDEVRANVAAAHGVEIRA